MCCGRTSNAPMVGLPRLLPVLLRPAGPTGRSAGCVDLAGVRRVVGRPRQPTVSLTAPRRTAPPAIRSDIRPAHLDLVRPSLSTLPALTGAAARHVRAGRARPSTADVGTAGRTTLVTRPEQGIEPRATSKPGGTEVCMPPRLRASHGTIRTAFQQSGAICRGSGRAETRCHTLTPAQGRTVGRIQRTTAQDQVFVPGHRRLPRRLNHVEASRDAC